MSVSKDTLRKQGKAMKDEAKALELEAARLRKAAGYVVKAADEFVIHRNGGNGKPRANPKPEPTPEPPAVVRVPERARGVRGQYGPRAPFVIAVYDFIKNQPRSRPFKVEAVAKALAAHPDPAIASPDRIIHRIQSCLCTTAVRGASGYQAWRLERLDSRTYVKRGA